MQPRCPRPRLAKSWRGSRRLFLSLWIFATTQAFLIGGIIVGLAIITTALIPEIALRKGRPSAAASMEGMVRKRQLKRPDVRSLTNGCSCPSARPLKSLLDDNNYRGIKKGVRTHVEHLSFIPSNFDLRREVYAPFEYVALLTYCCHGCQLH